MTEEILIKKTKGELISEDMREIISYKPHWMIRKGNTIFFFILAGLLLLTWFIQYPDTINGNARLVAVNPPKPVASKSQGKLMRLFVSNEEQVRKNQPLAHLESTADYNEVQQLHEWIGKALVEIKNGKHEVVVAYQLPSFMNLGELQLDYQAFQNQLAETKQVLSSGYYQQKRKSLEKDMRYLASLKNATYKQQQLLEQDQQLQKKEYEAYEALEKDKVIAPLELNQYKTKLIAKEQNLGQVKMELTNSDIASHNKEKEILDLQKSIFDQQQKFHSSLLELKSKVEKWMEQYVLVAPEGGKVSYASSIEENELVSNGQELFFIQPKHTVVYAELMVPQKRFGKLDSGQKVILKVDSYPDDEYGFVNGIVGYVSGIPNRRDSFLVRVDLPRGLKTSYNKEVFFRNNLSASAEIITAERRLFDRLLGKLKKFGER